MIYYALRAAEVTWMVAATSSASGRRKSLSQKISVRTAHQRTVRLKMQGVVALEKVKTDWNLSTPFQPQESDLTEYQLYSRSLTYLLFTLFCSLSVNSKRCRILVFTLSNGPLYRLWDG
jgi:hypothetical protein